MEEREEKSREEREEGEVKRSEEIGKEGEREEGLVKKGKKERINRNFNNGEIERKIRKGNERGE